MSAKEQKNDGDIIELLRLYFDEWKYRLDNFRKHMVQLIVIIFFTSSLPVTVDIFKDVKIPKMPLLIFPVVGILLTFVFLWYSLSEASRIISLDTKIKLIIRENFPDKYAKTSLLPMANNKIASILNKRMTVWIPIVLTIIEILIAVFMIYLICNNSI